MNPNEKIKNKRKPRGPGVPQMNAQAAHAANEKIKNKLTNLQSIHARYEELNKNNRMDYHTRLYFFIRDRNKHLLDDNPRAVPSDSSISMKELFSIIDGSDNTKLIIFVMKWLVLEDVLSKVPFRSTWVARVALNRKYPLRYVHVTALDGHNTTHLVDRIEEPDSRGHTPLHKAVINNNVDLVKALSKFGANVNLDGSKRWRSIKYEKLSGDTPLHDAVGNGNYEMVLTLINHGADVNAVNNKNETALDIAQSIPTNLFSRIMDDDGVDSRKIIRLLQINDRRRKMIEESGLKGHINNMSANRLAEGIKKRSQDIMKTDNLALATLKQGVNQFQNNQVQRELKKMLGLKLNGGSLRKSQKRHKGRTHKGRTHKGRTHKGRTHKGRTHKGRTHKGRK